MIMVGLEIDRETSCVGKESDIALRVVGRS